MPEAAPENSTTPEGTPEVSATESTEPQQPIELGDAGKKAIDAMKAERDAARREARANSGAAKKLQEIEDRDKSEIQKATDKLAALERERDDARVETMRLRVAVKHSIAEEDAELFLTGTDEDTLTRQAQRLAEREASRKADEQTAEAERQKHGNRVPKEGTESSGSTESTSELAFARSLFGGDT